MMYNYQNPKYSMNKSSGIHAQVKFYSHEIIGGAANDNGPLLSEIAALEKDSHDLRDVLNAIDKTLSDPSTSLQLAPPL